MSVTASFQNDRRRRLEVRFETILIAIVIVFLAVVFAPTTLVVAFAMAPTVLMFVLDGDPQKNRTLSVGALNLAGTVPALFELWARWNTLAGAVEMIATAHPWRLAFGGALLGWLMNWLIPIASANYMVKQRESSLGELEKRQELMRDVWGLDVDPRWRAPDPEAPVPAAETTAGQVTEISAAASAEPAPESL
ncbi:hypothetical protein TMPK1_17480 [Rhodospirillales bacterium TMPK1]|uniref:Uncharacterized protein n=2 Tax=Roseiterribacter gracilis TaxID=2812848 RepID=A0A8S8XCD0_9PROT|nr:hypothetical protein TMPK1_17480 [Rhodospirillales bacterium TMPK1]